MLKRIFDIILIIFLISFLYYIIIIYKSDLNIKKIYENRSKNTDIDLSKYDIPILQSDTKNVIEFNEDITNNKFQKKRNFWNLIKNK